MKSTLYNSQVQLFILVFLSLSLTFCKGDSTPATPTIPSTFNFDGVEYRAEKATLKKSTNTLEMYKDSGLQLEEKLVQIVLNGTPNGSTVTGFQVGTFTLGSSNIIYFHTGRNSLHVLRTSVSGKVVINSMEDGVTGTFDCLLSDGKVLTGNLNRVVMNP